MTGRQLPLADLLLRCSPSYSLSPSALPHRGEFIFPLSPLPPPLSHHRHHHRRPELSSLCCRSSHLLLLLCLTPPSPDARRPGTSSATNVADPRPLEHRRPTLSLSSVTRLEGEEK
uniref:Uncharacterized protein n=1 Tax=Oryza meridionalis TaxID=40149 RepID=A0A0E0EWN8_9ORYZ